MEKKLKCHRTRGKVFPERRKKYSGFSVGVHLLVESGSAIHTIQQIPKTVEKQVGSEATKLLKIVRIKDSWEELHKLQKIVTG